MSLRGWNPNPVQVESVGAATLTSQVVGEEAMATSSSKTSSNFEDASLNLAARVPSTKTISPPVGNTVYAATSTYNKFHPVETNKDEPFQFNKSRRAEDNGTPGSIPIPGAGEAPEPDVPGELNAETDSPAPGSIPIPEENEESPAVPGTVVPAIMPDSVGADAPQLPEPATGAPQAPSAGTEAPEVPSESVAPGLPTLEELQNLESGTSNTTAPTTATNETAAPQGGKVGASYCTFAPNPACYKTGWPACCGATINVCPAKQPACELGVAASLIGAHEVSNPPGEGVGTEAPEIPTTPESTAPELPTTESNLPQVPSTITEAPELPETNAPAEVGGGASQEGLPPGDGEEFTPTGVRQPDNLPTDKPIISPPQSPGKNASPSCNTLSCKGLAVLDNHPLVSIALLFFVSLLCCLRCCGRARDRDSRGEYRAVGRMLASNFDAELSDEDMNFYASDEDDDPRHVQGWSNHSKGSIELGSIGGVNNDPYGDGLTLEEMNG